jgi:L-rhamnose mutarotase
MRSGFVMRIREGREAEYRELHAQRNPLGDGIREACRRAGFRNYSLFTGGPTGNWVFGYFETDDLDTSIASLGADPANDAWQAMVTPLMELPATFADSDEVTLLAEVFHLE